MIFRADEQPVDRHVRLLHAQARDELQRRLGVTRAPVRVWAHNTMNLTDNLSGRASTCTPATASPTRRSGSTSTSDARRGHRAVGQGQATTFLARARKSGAEVTPPSARGIHNWPYWRRELPLYMKYGPVGAPPVTTTARKDGLHLPHDGVARNAWGIGFKLASPPSNVIYFRRTGQHLRVEGTGTITLTDACRRRRQQRNGGLQRDRHASGRRRHPGELLSRRGGRLARPPRASGSARRRLSARVAATAAGTAPALAAAPRALLLARW